MKTNSSWNTVWSDFWTVGVTVIFKTNSSLQLLYISFHMRVGTALLNLVKLPLKVHVDDIRVLHHHTVQNSKWNFDVNRVMQLITLVTWWLRVHFVYSCVVFIKCHYWPYSGKSRHSIRCTSMVSMQNFCKTYDPAENCFAKSKAHLSLFFRKVKLNNLIK